jgi:5-methylcytosine-specific restriction protein A
MCYKAWDMSDTYFTPASPEHVAREKAKARELRQSQWWRNQIGKGICYYCEQKFSKEFLTMDHVIPVIRGGLSARSNVVVCCKECNSKKQHMTPVEMTFSKLS